MRTAIFLGLLYIAFAIRENVFEGEISFIGTILLIAMVMDIIDFFRTKGK